MGLLVVELVAADLISYIFLAGLHGVVDGEGLSGVWVGHEVGGNGEGAFVVDVD